MEKHTRRLRQANQNTNNAYRAFRRDLDLLEEELFRLMERHAVAETHAPLHQLRNNTRKLSLRIDELYPHCTLAMQLPDVQGKVLKNLDCPGLQISK